MNLVGVYEKSLPARDLPTMLASTRTAGYDFFELAIDEHASRIQRLAWTIEERKFAREAIRSTGVPISTITLSAHRAKPLGSASAETRSTALSLLVAAIELAADLNAPMVQIAGYYVYYEPHHRDARRYFLEGLHQGCTRAAELGITLGLENVDGEDITSVEDGLAVITELGHPALGLHVDIGNLAGNQHDVISNLTNALPFLVAVDFKDARPGVFRRVPFGYGDVPFDRVWATLDAAGYRGPWAIEMWNDQTDDTTQAYGALRWVIEQRGRASFGGCSATGNF